MTFVQPSLRGFSTKKGTKSSKLGGMVVKGGQEILASLKGVTKNDKEYHAALCKEIELLRREYYEGKPSLADDEYDILFKEVAQIENKHPELVTELSPTQTPGPRPNEDSGRAKRTHLAPMLGLNNAFNDEDLYQFESRISKLVLQLREEQAAEKAGKAVEKKKAGKKKADASPAVTSVKQEYVAEMKYDGIAASLVFVGGKFKYAASRGDGVVGEDFTGSFLEYVKNGVPVSPDGSSVVLPASAQEIAGKPGVIVEIRGELVVSIAEFERINAHLKASGGKAYSNPRSVVSGLMNRQADSKTAVSAGQADLDPKLDMVCYTLNVYNGLEKMEEEAATKSKRPSAGSAIYQSLHTSSHWQKLDTLKDWGFAVCPHSTKCSNFPEVAAFVHKNQTEDARKQLPYAADGMVVKVNDERVQEQLGTVGRAYRWAVAYKFWNEKASTLLKEIVWQVGRTGKATPVAELVPVNLGGSMISRATLHNIRFIESNSIEAGSTIVVERSGGTIPKIAGRADKKTGSPYAKKGTQYLCPCVLKKPLSRDSRGVDLHCKAPECPAQNSRAVLHFAQTLGIKGLGERVVDELIERGFVLTASEIFFLHERRAELEMIPGWGEKKVENILGQIEQGKRDASVVVVMQALGIPSIGKRVCVDLFGKFQFSSVWELAEASIEDLQYRGVGKAAAKKLHDFFVKPETKNMLGELTQAGLPLTKSEY